MNKVLGSTDVMTEDSSGAIKIYFFKSDTCPHCPEAERVLYEAISGFEDDVFQVIVINVSSDPAAAEEFGVFAVPTIMVNGRSLTGIPEPEAIFQLIMGMRLTNRSV